MKYLFVFLICLIFGANVSFAQNSFSREVRFARGKSSASLTGTIPNADQTHVYTLSAREGQRIEIRLTSTNSKIGFTFSNSDDLFFENEQGTKIIRLPLDGSYQIAIGATGDFPTSQIRNARYTLKITIL
jgi:hypothetical protein